MKKLILVIVALLLGVPFLAAANRKPAFQQNGVRSGMTQSEVTKILNTQDERIRFLLDHCSYSDLDDYVCYYNTIPEWNNESMTVMFNKSSDRVFGFNLQINTSDDSPEEIWTYWKWWWDDIVKQLGMPTSVEDHPDSVTIKKAEWMFRDEKGKKLEDIRLFAFDDSLNVVFEDYEAEGK